MRSGLFRVGSFVVGLLMLIAVMPLSAVPVMETETTATPTIVIELVDTLACTTFTDAGGATASSCTAIANAIADAIAAECEEHGGELGHFELVSCLYLGGGYYHVRAEASCVY